MDKKKENADKRLKELQDFKLMLDLKGKTIKDAHADTMKKQLRWHWDIGDDDEIPPGFHHFKKVELWNAVTEAVKRHQEKQISCKGKYTVCSSPSAPDCVCYPQPSWGQLPCHIEHVGWRSQQPSLRGGNS